MLLQHADVRDAVVVVREDSPPVGGHPDQRLVAYLVAGTAPAPTVDHLRRHLQVRLPDYMVPSTFVYLDALPLSPNGKVDRKRLPEPDGTRPHLERIYEAPRSRIESLLTGIWAEHFHIERVGIHDTFFELGGNSIQAAVFINRLQELLGEFVSVIALFEAPTVADLASYLMLHHSVALARAGLIDNANAASDEQEHDHLGQILPVERTAELLLPLSFAQQRLWFLDQLEPGSPLYNIPTAMRLRGTLDREALQRSIDMLIDRHESLRTTFAMVDGQPVQVIAPTASIVLTTLDLRALPPSEHDGRVQQLVIEDAQRPFDLQHGPLIRATLALLRSDDTRDEHLLLFTLHHIITDGWSMGVLIRELAMVYLAMTHEQPVMLPPLPIQYADFAIWQRQWLQGPVLEQQLAYWKGQLCGAPAGLDLPTDYPRPSVQSFRGAAESFTIPPALTQALRTLSLREGVTLFMTLLAAWQTLLFRYSGQHDISIGTPIANRTRREIEGLMG